MMRAAWLWIAVAACDAPATGVPVVDGLVSDDADPDIDAPPGCIRPPLDAPWLGTELARWVGDLTVRPRATIGDRDAARAYLQQQLVAQGWTAEFQTYAGGANVVADIPATRPEPGARRTIVGAHFDTVDGSPGASDNASGSAVVLALGRFLAETPCRTAPVSLVLFDQEELGFFGSRAYVAAQDPATIAAAHTIDQVGWDSDGDRIFELERPAPALEAAWRAGASRLGVTVVTTSTGGTDHESFRDVGIAAVGLSEEYVGGDTSPHRHTAGDVASTIDLPYLATAAQLTASVILEAVSP